MTFINLHTHSTYSLMDSIIQVKDLFQRTKELSQPAVAITDHGSIAAAHDGLKASKDTGVKLIIGTEAYFVDNLEDQEERFRHIILLAKNATGYKNLLSLNKAGYDNSVITFKKVYPRITWSHLEKYGEGLIITTSCANGILGQLINQKKFQEAKEQALRLKTIFGDNLAIEIQANTLVRNENLYSYKVDQAFTNKKLIELAYDIGAKLIATTNAHYLTKDQSEAHDVLLSIGSGVPKSAGNRLKYNVSEFYLKSEQEIMEYFSRGFYRTYGENFAKMLCDNTVYFADMCEQPNWIDPKFSEPGSKGELPKFPVKNQPDYQEFKNWQNQQNELIRNLEDDKAYLRFCCEKQFDLMVAADKKEEYRQRLEEEYDVLETRDFSSYMLIVADYVNWAKNNDIRVGAGRGSIGGSLVGYFLKIHTADPLPYKLIFARFQNKDKTSFPDIDCDFAPAGRDRVQAYIRNKYGIDNVAHVSNVNTITPKVYARDLARSFMFGDDSKKAVLIGTQIADSIPKEVHSIKSALEHAPLFGEYCKVYPQLKEFADTIGGKARAWSTHAAGLVIGKRPLVGLVPLRKDKDGTLALEYEKERAEDNGLVKLDTLGLETLDIIDLTHQLINNAGKELPPDPPNYEQYDKLTYDLIGRGDTFCVFQLGTSGGTIDLCRKIKPKNIDDLAIITSLARPAAKEIREPYIKVRNGEESFELLHPTLERAFRDTLGFPLFEECLMYLAQDVAGWDMNHADRLRKLTKDKGKHPEKVAQWRLEFIADAQKNKGLTEKMATKIWDEIVASFGGYAFNRAHAVLYSMISYHTAYLKAHYPVEFLVANLMSEVRSNAKAAKDNIIKIKDEIRNLKVEILPPNINTSEMTYKLVGNNKLMTGLDALKNVGEAVPEIIAKRPFTDFEDFLTRTDGKKVRAPAIQALAASGCLDQFGMSRKQMFLYASDYKKKLQVWTKRKNKDGNFQYPWPNDVGEWTVAEKFALESHYLGEGLSGTLKERYPGFFDGKLLGFRHLPDLYPQPAPDEKLNRSQQREKFGLKGVLKGVIRNQFKFRVKKQDSAIFGKIVQKVVLRDHEGTELTCVIFPDDIERVEDQLKMLGCKNHELEAGMAISFSGVVSYYEGEVSIIIDHLFNYMPSPPLPSDREGRKVKLPRATRKKKEEKEEVEIEEENSIENIENDLIDEGIIDEEDDIEEEIEFD